MLMIFYVLPASFVFAIALHTLMQDATASKTDAATWVCFLLAAVLWPVTLPTITWKKCLALVTSVRQLPALHNQISLM